MGKRYFGTDGVRGLTNSFPITAEMALRLGLAAGRHFTKRTGRHLVVIGKDTRLSGYMLEPALVAGFTSVGMDVVLFGPLPTPGVSQMTLSLRADMGVMITASHNLYHDNGIKLFGPDGQKLDDETEVAIERMMDSELTDSLAAPSELGRVKRIEDAQARYVELAKATFPRKKGLSGLRIVVDCANGAAYQVAPKVLWELGADVVAIGVQPNGFNINQECGSTAPQQMCAAVREHQAHIGLALDGDGDRLVLCDENGQLVDGDQILALLASHWKASGALDHPEVIATVMSNLGLERCLADQGLSLYRSRVGDRYVAKRMKLSGATLGGEPSGHILTPRFCPTGDGLIAALKVLRILVEADRPASEILHVFEPVPQLLESVRVDEAASVLSSDPVKDAIRAAEARLGNAGRVLVRASGTEPLIRVMAEGEPEEIRKVVDDLKSSIADVCSPN